MPFELRENSFLLFKNQFKDKNPKAPDYKGEGLINGRAHEAAIWIKEGQREEFFSMVLKPKEQQAPPKQEESTETNQSDIPF